MGEDAGLPEFHLDALRRSLSLGVDYIEWDVMLLGDELRAHHDARLGRETNAAELGFAGRRPDRLSVAEAARLRQKSCSGRIFEDAPPPTNREILETLLAASRPGYEPGAFIEMKMSGSEVPAEKRSEALERLAADLDALARGSPTERLEPGRVTFISFSLEQCLQARLLLHPAVRIMPLAHLERGATGWSAVFGGSRLGKPELLKLTEALIAAGWIDGLNPNCGAWTPGDAARIRAAGGSGGTWDLRANDTVTRYLDHFDKQLDFFTTDFAKRNQAVSALLRTGGYLTGTPSGGWVWSEGGREEFEARLKNGSIRLPSRE